MKPGDVYTRQDGAAVRVDFVTDEEIYFVSWAPGEETGHPKRMSVKNFKAALKHENMSKDKGGGE